MTADLRAALAMVREYTGTTDADLVPGYYPAVRQVCDALEATLDDVTATEHAVRAAVQSVLWNASNYPERAQSRMAGADIAPLTAKVTDAVLAVLRPPAEVEATERAWLALESIREWEMRHVGQWIKGAEPTTFDRGVGAAAHDILERLELVLADLDARQEARS